MKRFFTLTATNHKIRKGFFFLLFLLLTNLSVMGQTSNQDEAQPLQVANSEIATGSVRATEANQTESINFLNWFMGTKQTPNSGDTNETRPASAKTQILQSGIAPNRVLMKTFLKKTMNTNVAIA